MFVSLLAGVPKFLDGCPVWTAAALAVTILGRRLEFEDLSHQAHAFAFAAFLSTRWRSISTPPRRGSIHPYRSALSRFRWSSSSSISARAGRARPAQATRRRCRRCTPPARPCSFWCSLYRECNWAWMGVTWAVGALILAMLGIRFQRRDFNYQAHVLALAAFARTLIFDFDATQEFHHFTYRFMAFVSTAALLYLCAYFSGPRETQAARVFSAIHFLGRHDAGSRPGLPGSVLFLDRRHLGPVRSSAANRRQSPQAHRV